MTTEEKAKAYDKALERAKQKIDAGFLTEDDLSYIFPELRESEDERARKAALAGIEYLEREIGWDVIDDIDILDVKDYLEKQKEQNREDEGHTDFTIYHPLKNGKGKYECIPYSFYGSITSFSEDKDLIDFLRTCFYTKEECNEWIEQQKEQKPTDKEQDSISFLEQHGYTIVPPHAPVSIVPSSEATLTKWSEEDERMVRFYVDDYDNNLGNMSMRDVIENRIKFKDWLLNRLKFLRPQSQKLEEWTEEDERMWKSALWHIKNSCGNGGKNSGEFDVYQWFKNRVKSLRLIKQEWNEEDEKNLKQCIEIVRGWEIDYDYANPHYSNWLKSVRLQTREEVYQSVKHDLAIKFMNYLDENRPEGKMSLSNGECKDIDKAFKENDWAKIIRYVEKYKPHWKPNEEQMKALDKAIPVYMGIAGKDKAYQLVSFYEQLKKQM